MRICGGALMYVTAHCPRNSLYVFRNTPSLETAPFLPSLNQISAIILTPQPKTIHSCKHAKSWRMATGHLSSQHWHYNCMSPQKRRSYFFSLCCKSFKSLCATGACMHSGIGLIEAAHMSLHMWSVYSWNTKLNRMLLLESKPSPVEARHAFFLVGIKEKL